MMSIFKYLKYGLAAVLVFIGIKLCLTDLYKISIGVSLGVIACSLGSAMVVSIVETRLSKQPKTNGGDERGE